MKVNYQYFFVNITVNNIGNQIVINVKDPECPDIYGVTTQYNENISK